MTIELEQKQKRLTSGKKGCYDKVGNREQVTENAITTPYNPNILNQYDSVNANPLNYDLNGNLVAQNGWSYIYDAQNRLIQASNSTTLASFNYDARNRCVQRTINGNTTYLYYDDWNLIEERDPSDNLTTVYFHGAQIDELLLKITLTNTVYYHHDVIGNVNHLTDKNGHVLEKYIYDAFGSATILNSVNQVLQASSYANRFLFTGREYLKELRLYDYRNRIYSAHLGRFLQTDPIGLTTGINLYRYCNNNSILWMDPWGLIQRDSSDPEVPEGYDPDKPGQDDGWGEDYCPEDSKEKPNPKPEPEPNPDPRPNPGPNPSPRPNPTPNPGPSPIPGPGPEPGLQDQTLELLTIFLPLGKLGMAGKTLGREAALTATKAVSPAVREAMYKGGIEKLSWAERTTAAKYYEKIAQTARTEAGRALNQARARYAREGGMPPGGIQNYR